MGKATREKSTRSRPNPTKALALHRKLLKEGLEDRFQGMSEEEIIRAMRKTREEIWGERIAPALLRPDAVTQGYRLKTGLSKSG